MFRRLFWLGAGVAIGVWGTAKVNRAARRLTPGGLAETAADRAVELGGRLRQFTDDVRAGMAEREAELGRTLNVPGPGAAGERTAAHESTPDGGADRGTGHATGHGTGLTHGPTRGLDQGLPGQRTGTAYNRKDEH